MAAFISCSTSRNSNPLAVDPTQCFIDLLDDDGSQAKRYLVADDKLRVGHDGPGNGKHLELTAREKVCKLTRLFPEDRKSGINLLQVSAFLFRACGGYAPMRRFSRTVISSKTRLPSGAIDIPCVTILLAGCARDVHALSTRPCRRMAC
jgi:hypothetical protein